MFTFLNFLTTTCLVELIFLSAFRCTKYFSSKDAINQWYTNLRWTAIILDMLSVMIGFYLAYFSYKLLKINKIVGDKNSILIYLPLVLLIQISHDLLFYFLVIKNTKKGSSIVMDEFINYASKSGINAVLGDSLMYITGVPLLFYIATLADEIKVFLSLTSIYIIGYLLYKNVP